MVVGAFPAAKLGALLLKQISKPIANAIKSQAKSSPVFRKYICMPPAQFYNWCEVKSKMWILNLGKPVNIPVLSEAMAIELGANLVGEGIIFAIAAGILISEYNRSANKEAAKEEAKLQEMIEIQNTIRELFIQTEEQAAQIRELNRKLGSLDTKLGTPNPPSNEPGSKSESTTPKSSDDKKQNKNEDRYTDRYIIDPAPENSYKSNKNLNIQPMNYTEISSRSKTHYSSLILKAVDELEDQFWGYSLVEHQEDNILFLSLYHVQTLLRLQD